MPVTETPSAPPRVVFIDALRGIAACQVVVFHVFTAHAGLGFGEKYQDIVVFRDGWLGVELFFMISGFVILMTLHKCANFIDFILKRYWRLLPAILIAVLFSYAFAHAFPSVAQYRPNGVPNLKQVLMSLTLLQPQVHWDCFGVLASPIEASFWSLFVELKFYFIFGMMFFFMGERGALVGLIVLSALVVLSKYALILYLWDILNKMNIVFFPWFAVGALGFVFHRDRNLFALFLALLMAAAGVYAVADDRSRVAAVVTYASVNILLFILPLLSGAARRILEWRLPLFFGFVSYPLYLLHENFIASLLGYASGQPEGVRFAVAAMAFSNVLALAWLVATYGEAHVRLVFEPVWRRFRIALGAESARRDDAREGQMGNALAARLDAFPEINQLR